jgi:hypothetical protein
MVPDPVIVRLEILKVLLPMASRHGISEPEEIVKTAARLAAFVLESPQQGAASPDTPDKRTLRLPRKEKPADATPDFMTPPPVDKSNQAHG